MKQRIKKSVAIITFHFPQNNGAVLQNIALCEVLRRIGFCPKVIDYRPKYHTNVYRPIRNPFLSACAIFRHCEGSLLKKIYKFVRNTVSNIISERYCVRRFRLQKKFDSYIEEMLPLTKRYETIEQLRQDAPNCEAYIAGSDQIWNPIITNQTLDLAYMLDFGTEHVLRIGYAISEYMNENDIASVQQYLAKFHALSFREENSANKFKQYYKGACHVLDPTLLIDAEDYEKYEKIVEDVPEKYILFIGLKNSKGAGELLEILRQVYARMQMQIVDISPTDYRISFGTNIKKCVSPGEFLHLIKNAEFVVTNSFHAMAFSVLYKKQFSISLPGHKKDRLVSLLKLIGLSDYIYDEQKRRVNYQTIDYEEAHEKLHELRQNSYQFLEQSLLRENK